MIIRIRTHPNSKRPRVTKTGTDSFDVRIDEKAEDGKANRRLVEMLSAHFNVPKSSVRVIRGFKGRDKLVEIRGLLYIPATEYSLESGKHGDL